MYTMWSEGTDAALAERMWTASGMTWTTWWKSSTAREATTAHRHHQYDDLPSSDRSHLLADWNVQTDGG